MYSVKMNLLGKVENSKIQIKSAEMVPARDC